MNIKSLPQSTRKYIRQEKGRIRREVSDLEKQETLINALNQRFHHK
jgi:hypothetical protein